MKKVEEIKEGLQYSINPVFVKQEDISYISRTSERITLTCQFSGLECNINFINPPFSHEIEFTFHLNYLKTFSSDLKLALFPERQQHNICCNTQMILHEIVTSKLNGVFKNMFLESKALSLLLCFQKCNTISQIDCGSCKFLTKPVEKEKIVNAREIILSKLTNPPTIPELSMQIGINQCYLKKGFKELYGMTVYDFIQEQRMLKAKLLLTQNRFTVSQVAEQIGFSSVSNFSSAFKKFAGVFPSELQKN